MPLMNSTGAFKQQKNFVTTVPIIGQQWIAQFTTSATTVVYCQPVASGDTYILWDNKVIKLNSDGNKTFANQYSVYVSPFCSCYDSSNNLFVGGQIDGWAGVIKYDSSGNIVWQKQFGSVYSVISVQPGSSGDVLVMTGDISPVNGFFGPYVMWRINSSGTVINQRKLLKTSTTSLTSMYVDTTNSKLYVTGTDFTTPSRGQIITGTYGLTNNDAASQMVIQSSATDNYLTAATPYIEQTIVSDSTYLYQIGYRVISGTTRSVYMKINSSTGAISYSNSIVIGGVSCTINGITSDNANYIFVYGNISSSDTGNGFVSKIRMSDGVIIWTKRLGGGNQYIWNMQYNGGFLYITTENVTGGYKGACIKLNSDGSLPDGTYATSWVFATVSATTTSYNAGSTGTTTGSSSTTAYSSAAAANSVTTASVTVTTTNIP